MSYLSEDPQGIVSQIEEPEYCDQCGYHHRGPLINCDSDEDDSYDVEECPEFCDECGASGFVKPDHFHAHGLHWETHTKHPAHFTGEAVCSCGGTYCEDEPGFVPYTGQP